MADSMLPFEQGGLPERARARLRESRADGKSLFSTTFTVAEMAIARAAGYTPLGQVMGSSIYHVGWRNYIGYAGGELTNVTEAQRHARQLALGRLAQEADALDADAVIGVKLERRGYEWSGELMEFTAIGTAVRTAQPQPAGAPRPVLSNLTVQQLYKLELAGLWPLGIVMGNCTWYDYHCDCAADGNWFNQEMSGHTLVLQQARAYATERLQAEVQRHAALGVVGVTVERKLHEEHRESNHSEHTSFLVEVLLLGTAVQRRAEPRLPRPRLVLDLGDRKIDLGARTTNGE
jgi:uncharacterized protein YbjQ (UPF0145 family)